MRKASIQPFVPQRQFVSRDLTTTDHARSPAEDVEFNEPEYGPLLQWFVNEGERVGWDELRLCVAIRHWALKLYCLSSLDMKKLWNK